MDEKGICPKCKELKKIRIKSTGLCGACYKRSLLKIEICKECKLVRPIVARNMCSRCYVKWQRKTYGRGNKISSDDNLNLRRNKKKKKVNSNYKADYIKNEQIIETVAISHTYKEVAQRLNMSATALYQLRKRRNLDQVLDTSHFVKYFDNANWYKRKPSEFIFVKESNSNSRLVRKRILEDKLIPYKCSECGIVDVWMNKPIRLELHHINGNRKDNRLKNLTFLCPNCHTQTPTHPVNGNNGSEIWKEFVSNNSFST